MEIVEDKSIKTKLYLENDRDFNKIISFGEAISNPTRLNILKYLQNPPFIKTVPELAKELNIPITTLMHHLEKLEKGNLIKIRYKGSTAGTTRVVSRGIFGAVLKLSYGGYDEEERKNVYEQSVGVGCYTDFQGERLLFATADDYEPELDSPFNEKRNSAQLIFTTHGIITYCFSNKIAVDGIVKEISFSLELCSEASYYDNDYKSDITFWVNGKEIATYLSLGDYGDRRGLLTPNWWTSRNTQYGKMVNLTINSKGVYLNNKIVTEKIKVQNLELEKGNKIALSLGNKQGCEHPGGFNLFGKGFGDYPQDIILKIIYE